MLKKIEIEQYCSVGDIIQIVTDQTSGMGLVSMITENAIQLDSHNDEIIIEEYGDPVPVNTVFPSKEIKLILIIKRD